MQAAAQAAQRAQKLWAAEAPARRAEVLARTAEILRRDNEALSVLETLDTGKPISETRVADAASGAECFAYYAARAAHAPGELLPLEGGFGWARRAPFGVCLGIGAWNYPIQIAAWKAAPALACGNALIFKPAEWSPLTALKLGEALMEAGAPSGLFQVLQGGAKTAGALIDDARIAKVSLTGSAATGRAVMAAAATAAGGPKPVSLELGGKSPLIVFADADLDAAAQAAADANFYSSGQVCSNGTRVFVEASVMEAFTERFRALAEGMTAGDPLDDATALGPLIAPAQGEKVMAFIERAKREGAKLVCGGERLEVSGFPGGFFVAATIFASVEDEMELAREEVFGPVASLLSFASEEEAVRRANATPYGLAAGVFSRDLARAWRVRWRVGGGGCVDQRLQHDACGAPLRRGQGLGLRARERHGGLGVLEPVALGASRPLGLQLLPPYPARCRSPQLAAPQVLMPAWARRGRGRGTGGRRAAGPSSRAGGRPARCGPPWRPAPRRRETER